VLQFENRYVIIVMYNFKEMKSLEILRSILLGVVEGITEWLPISSTGHMILVNEFLHNDGFTNSDLYLYVIQLGAILAVVTMFFGKLWPFSLKKTKSENWDTWQMWFKIAVASIPAGIIGVFLNDYMDSIENGIIVATMLIIYGIAFILIERKKKPIKIDSIKDISYKTALLIGLFQAVSVIPGTSRSGATILGAMILGCSRTVSAEFCFFLSIPIMFGISAIKILTFDGVLTGNNIAVLITGMAVAYAVSMLSIKFLMGFVKKHSFTGFGWYRIGLGIIVLLCFVAGVIG